MIPCVECEGSGLVEASMYYRLATLVVYGEEKDFITCSVCSGTGEVENTVYQTGEDNAGNQS